MDSKYPSATDGLVVFVPETPAFSILESKAGGRLRSIGGDAPSVGSANLGPNVLRAGNGFRCGPNMSNGGTWTNFRGDTCGVDLLRLAGRTLKAPRSTGRIEKPSPVTAPAVAKKRQRTSPSIESLKKRVSSIFESYSAPERIRLSVDSIHPEALSKVSPETRIAKIRELRPTKLFPNARSRRKTLTVTDEDRESEKYIRSLGVSLLREIEEEVAASGVTDDAFSSEVTALDRQMDKIDALIDRQESLVGAVISSMLRENGLSLEEESRYVARAVRSSKNEHGFDMPTLLNRLKNIRKTDPDNFANVNVRVFKVASPDGKQMEIEIAMVQGPASKGLKPIVSFRKLQGGEVNLKKIDKNDPLDVAALGMSKDLNKPYLGKSVLERVAETGDTYDSLTKVITDRNRQSLLSPKESATREAVKTVLKRHGVTFGSIDASEVVFQLDKSGTPVKNTNMAIVVHAESGGLSPSEQADVMASLQEIFEFLPESWTNILKKNGINIGFAKRGVEYRAQQVGQEDGSSIISMPHYWTGGDPELISLDDFKSTMLHEIIHALQHNNPEMDEAEFLHFILRTDGDISGRKLSDLVPEVAWDEDEIAVPDDADNAYTFKIYQNSNKIGRPITVRELSAMLMQTLDGRGNRSKGDLDALAWMLGLMLEQGSR